MKSLKIVVVGGGISGLATAFHLCELKRAGDLALEITLLEEKSHFGGVIQTRQENGFLLESGPDSFLTEKPQALDLCKRLGIESEIIPTNSQNQYSYIYYHQKLIRIPAGFYLFAPVRLRGLIRTPFLSWRGKLRMACEPLIPRRNDTADESVGSFIARRFGRETLERVGQPMLSGIYGGDTDRMSLQATMPRFLEMEKQYGSVSLAMLAERKQDRRDARKNASGPRYRLMMSLRQGMGSLVQKLITSMPDVNLNTSSAVSQMLPGENWQLLLKDGTSCDADVVCLAVPSWQAAKLLEPFEAEASGQLADISYSSLVTVHIAFRKADMPLSFNGFGFVVPSMEGKKILGCTFSSIKFSQRAPGDTVLLRLLLGGVGNESVEGMGDESIEVLVREEIKIILGIQAAPLFVRIFRHPAAIPQYHVGHLKRIEEVDSKLKRFPGLFLTGSAYRGIGVPDCIHQGEETANDLIDYCKQQF